MSKVHIIDTNILCCLLNVKTKDTIGNGEITKEKIQKKIEEIQEKQEYIAIPFPVMLEIGNFIGHQKDRKAMLELNSLIKKTFDMEAPWHNFKNQEKLWSVDILGPILDKWEEVLFEEIGLGDLFVLVLKEAYEKGKVNMRAPTEIWSADENLLKCSEWFKVFPEEKRIRKSRN